MLEDERLLSISEYSAVVILRDSLIIPVADGNGNDLICAVLQKFHYPIHESTTLKRMLRSRLTKPKCKKNSYILYTLVSWQY